ncbi:adenosylcobinamide-phosphate synthase [Kitasatospora sp. GAS204A]|uniref:cobalamin biosynthesis protein n=1 Tax=unclassified Kitasatospora TaxID=2633591 RepID=UPI00247641B2|nr:cobalamin biosynthesis protein [Kitasatospora sp. GAS204B]MDH6117371.1 adenosylcobinamide-phosphate synthase [Kitasatospora sp. GAS204B]
MAGVFHRALPYALGALAGYAADARFGDPRRGHPVAAFGRAATRLERTLWRDHRGAGALHTALCVGAVAGGAAGLARLLDRGPRRHGALLTAAATWTVLGGSSLTREARTIGAALTAGDLAAARQRLPHLCGRDPSGLDQQQIARAVVESVAENTADAVVNALVWGALAGAPGLLGFRAVNTLDAMVGHKSPRYRRFGWAAARLDDLAGWPGARLTALLTVAAAEHRGTAWRVWRRDGGAHPSPNAGQAESAFAGALGVRLGGTLRYAYEPNGAPVSKETTDKRPRNEGAPERGTSAPAQERPEAGGESRQRVEERPVLGAELRPVAVADIERACRLSRRVGLLALGTTVALRAAVLGRGPGRGRT